MRVFVAGATGVISSPGHAASRSARASLSHSPPSISSGSPANSRSSMDFRTANTSPTDSENSRRATKAIVCADTWSSQ